MIDKRLDFVFQTIANCEMPCLLMYVYNIFRWKWKKSECTFSAT